MRQYSSVASSEALVIFSTGNSILANKSLPRVCGFFFFSAVVYALSGA